jgi:homoserine kinase
VEQSRSGIRARCPASSANLGSGFDALGLALGLHNEVDAEITDAGLQVTVSGEGYDVLPFHGDNLVARAAASAFSRLGWRPPGLRLHCRNGIPPARGLGSSAAAIVAGISAAYALARPDDELDRTWVLEVAGAMEGHPDNVAACVLGGATVGWREDDGSTRAVRVEPSLELRATVFVPEQGASTSIARALLPMTVPHADAAHAAGRAALFVAAVSGRLDLLPAATEDRLHQQYRASSMPTTSALVRHLRAAGFAAIVSGAGPAVLVLHAAHPDRSGDLDAVTGDLEPGWHRRALDIDRGGVVVS